MKLYFGLIYSKKKLRKRRMKLHCYHLPNSFYEYEVYLIYNNELFHHSIVNASILPNRKWMEFLY